jgi:Amidohydrolase family
MVNVMLNRFAFFIIIKSSLALILPNACAQQYAIQNVSVIPMDKEGLLTNQTVFIKDGLIKQIGNSNKIKIFKNTTTIDGTGKYLMPGLMDMHMHFFYEQGLDKSFLDKELKLMLAKGLTTVRIMCGDPEYLNAKKNVANGQWQGPELVVVSPQLVGKWTFKIKLYGEVIETPAAARAAVKKFKAAGYDEIKITFFVKPDVYNAIVQTAKEEKIKVTGHVGPDVKLPTALAAKQQIEHLDEFIEMLLPDTSYNHGVSLSGTGIWGKQTSWTTVPHLDERRIPALVKAVKDAGIYVTPTNYFLITCFAKGQTDDEIKNSPDYSFIPKFLREEREGPQQIFWANPPSETDRKKYIDLRYKMTKALYDAGVPLMAGSDAPEWYLAQGFSLHNELEMFVKSGLNNFAALQTATINPANYLGFGKRLGSVTVGKQANLLLLDKNPLDDIRNTQSINAIFNGRQFYNSNQVSELLNEVKVLGN